MINMKWGQLLLVTIHQTLLTIELLMELILTYRQFMNIDLQINSLKLYCSKQIGKSHQKTLRNLYSRYIHIIL
jgi:hypothetical protein